MPKFYALMIAIMLCCCFISSCNADIALEMPDEATKSTSPLSAQEKSEIEKAWVAHTGYSFSWYSDDYLDGMRYYGKYNGYTVLFKPDVVVGEYSAIFGNHLLTSQKEFSIYAYKDKVFHNFTDLSKDSIISDQDMEAIASVHEQYEKEIQSLRKPTNIYDNENLSVPHFEDSVKNEIDAAYFEKTGVSLFSPSDSLSREVRYYGSFNGYEILFVSTPMCAVTTIEISGCSFTYCNYFNLYAYKDGFFHKLVNVYESNMISSEDVYRIAELHDFMNKQK